MKKPLKIDKRFSPCPVKDDDELYPNGFFVFNITEMNRYIESALGDFSLEEIEVNTAYNSFSSINETHVMSTDISKPVILAEISPGQYNLIDGHHRMEKALRLGVARIPSYRLNAEQHSKFLITEKGYIAFVNYWNDKLKSYNQHMSTAILS
ncbi:MAG: ParB N-terminal domain-containing protein [Methylococcales bacterium]